MEEDILVLVQQLNRLESQEAMTEEMIFALSRLLDTHHTQLAQLREKHWRMQSIIRRLTEATIIYSVESPEGGEDYDY